MRQLGCEGHPKVVGLGSEGGWSGKIGSGELSAGYTMLTVWRDYWSLG